MRTRVLTIALEMKVDDIAHVIVANGLKQVIDSYIASQAEGSAVKYGYGQKPSMDLCTAMMDIVVTDMEQALAKRNAIENKLNLLPQITNLVYLYREDEKMVQNVPE